MEAAAPPPVTVTEHEGAQIERANATTSTPVVIGHSFGGLLTEILAGRGLAAASVAISPAPFRGVLPLPVSALRSSSAVLRNPANWNRAVPLTFEQFRFAFANAVSGEEAQELYETYSVPGPGELSSRPRLRTSTRGRRRRSTRATRNGARFSSSPPTATTPSRGRSRTRPSRSRSGTTA